MLFISTLSGCNVVTDQCIVTVGGDTATSYAVAMKVDFSLKCCQLLSVPGLVQHI